MRGNQQTSKLSLIEIHLCGSGIDDAKAVLIGEALKVSTNKSLDTLSKLYWHICSQKFSSGAKR
jgi:hypothetical protein